MIRRRESRSASQLRQYGLQVPSVCPSAGVEPLMHADAAIVSPSRRSVDSRCGVSTISRECKKAGKGSIA